MCAGPLVRTGRALARLRRWRRSSCAIREAATIETPGGALGRRFFAILLVLGALFVAATLGDLPAVVATNFGRAGMPHAWMGRGAYAGYLTVIGVALPLLAVGLVARRRGARAGRWWLGSLLLGFALSLHVVLLMAHRAEPPRLSTTAFIAVLGLFVVGLAGWVVRWRSSS